MNYTSHRVILFVIFVFFVGISCNKNTFEEIRFPLQDVVCLQNGYIIDNPSIFQKEDDDNFKLVLLVDREQCLYCWLLNAYMLCDLEDCLEGHNLQTFMYVIPEEGESIDMVAAALNQNYLTFPTYVDTLNLFETFNPSAVLNPKTPFYLIKDNKVLVRGNPFSKKSCLRTFKKCLEQNRY